MEPTKLTIRARSTGPARRGGISLLPLGAWVTHELTKTVADARALLVLVEDAKVEVQLGRPKDTGEGEGPAFDWMPAPTAEQLRPMIAELEADEAEAAKIAAAAEPEPEPEPVKAFDFTPTGGALPTAEPTLEREAETDPKASVEEAAPPETPNADASDKPAKAPKPAKAQ